ncbi:MAG: hypothetical protein ACXABY_22475, partial [Candidatus Thorarchaeota archaeon]
MGIRDFMESEDYTNLLNNGYSEDDLRGQYAQRRYTPRYQEFFNSDDYQRLREVYSEDVIENTWIQRQGESPFADEEVPQARGYVRGQTGTGSEEYVERQQELEREQSLARGEAVQPASGGVLDIISRGEGVTQEMAAERGYQSPYDITLGYGEFADDKSTPVSQMTIAEVYDHMRLMRQHPENRFPTGRTNEDGTPERMPSSAVGRFQIIQPTLESLVEELGLSEDTVFSQEVQDAMGEALLNRRGYQEYLSGELSLEDFQRNMANEWASIANPDTGKSQYGQ